MRQRGLTLVELMIAVAMAAVIAMAALPGFSAAVERHRLRHAAETLAADFSEARYEAARSGRPLHVAIDGRSEAWCWNVATRPDCGCQAADRCQLKATHAREHTGIQLLQPQPAVFEPEGMVSAAGSATFRAPHGEMLRVSVGPMGRASVCSPGPPVPGYPAC